MKRSAKGAAVILAALVLVLSCPGLARAEGDFCLGGWGHAVIGMRSVEVRNADGGWETMLFPIFSKELVCLWDG